MQLTTLVLAAGLTLAAAQTTTSTSTSAFTSTSAAPIGTSSACAAQPYASSIPPRPKSLALTFLFRVLDACIATEQAQINGCSLNDYSCLCQQYGNLLTCYNNCPNDPGLFGVQQQKTQQCEAAQAYGTTTVMVAKSTSSSNSVASSTAVESSGFAGASGSSTATGTAASGTSSTGAAGALRVETAGGLLAVVAAGFGIFM